MKSFRFRPLSTKNLTMAKHILKADYDFNFILLSLSCHESDYRLCIAINNVFGILLEKESPIELKKKQQDDSLLFSFFSYYSEESFTEYNLIANKSFNSMNKIKEQTSQGDLFGTTQSVMDGQKILLLPELSEADFLFILRTDYTPELIEEVEEKIKKIPFVLQTNTIDPIDLPSKNNLIF